MKNLFIITLISMFIGSCSVFAYDKHYIKIAKAKLQAIQRLIATVKLYNTIKKGK